MKKALYYAIRVNVLYPFVVAVTSEKRSAPGSPVRRWYGRKMDDEMPTNGLPADIRGNFPTPESAASFLSKIGKVTKAYRRARSVQEREVTRLYQAEKAAVDEVFVSGRIMMPSMSDEARIAEITRLLHDETPSACATEADSFKIEAAQQMGFHCLNDDATLFYCSDGAILAVMRAAEAAGEVAATNRLLK